MQTSKKVTKLCQLLCFKKIVVWCGLQFKIPATYVMFPRLKGWRLAARVKQLPGAERLGAKFILMNLAMKLIFSGFILVLFFWE